MRRSARTAPVAIFLVTLVASAAVAVLVIRPFHVGAVGFDTPAAVLYFDRLVQGRHLETWVGSTPKPLITLLFGVLHTLIPEWRVLVWATIGAYATTIALAAVLAWRLAGWGAATFAAVALMGSTAWFLDVARGYGIAWALLGWVVAGLAVTADRPRYALAALALFLAALARVETFVLIGAALAGLVVWWWRGRRGEIAAPPRGAWTIAASLLALPVMFVHDALLTGDPGFWLAVSSRYSAEAAAAVAAQGPVRIAERLIDGFVELGGFAVLAVVGFAVLLAARRFAIALGVAAATVGIGALLVLLAARGTYVSSRYAVPVDLVVLFVAGIGFGAIRIAWRASIPRDRAAGPGPAPAEHAGPATRTATRAAAWAVAGALSAAVLLVPVVRGSQAEIRTLHREAFQARSADQVVPVVDRALAGVPGSGDRPDPSVALAPIDPGRVLLLVPAQQRPRYAVDTGLDLSRIAAIGGEGFDTAASLVAVPGRVIVHDPAAEGDGAVPFPQLEAPDPVIDGVRLTPLVVDPVRRIWVYQVPPAGSVTP